MPMNSGAEIIPISGRKSKGRFCREALQISCCPKHPVYFCRVNEMQITLPNSVINIFSRTHALNRGHRVEGTHRNNASDHKFAAIGPPSGWGCIYEYLN